MAHPRRFLVGVAATLALTILAACTPSTTSSSIPTTATSSATPTPSPSVTYGPNQTAAIAVVKGYYAWWNAARKNPVGPIDPAFGDLSKYVAASAYNKLTPMPYRDVSDLGSYGTRQVGDIVLAQVVPEAESSSRILVNVCLDRTGTRVVDTNGTTVNPRDSQTGATTSPERVFTRSSYTAVVSYIADRGWLITEITGGATPC